MMRKVVAVARKELRQIGRDRRTLMILLFVPAMFLLLYGYALNFDIRNVGLAVEDRDRTSNSRALVSAFVNSGYFDLVADITSEAELDRVVNRNEARLVLVIPARLRPRCRESPADARAGHHRRRERQHCDDGHGLCRDDRRARYPLTRTPPSP